LILAIIRSDLWVKNELIGYSGKFELFENYLVA
jgi:hypothetical protein